MLNKLNTNNTHQAQKSCWFYKLKNMIQNKLIKIKHVGKKNNFKN